MDRLSMGLKDCMSRRSRAWAGVMGLDSSLNGVST